MPYPALDLSNVRTYPLSTRENLTKLENLVMPNSPVPPFDNPELDAIAHDIVAARRRGSPVMWMIGGHVVKRGLSPILIDMMERGLITHIASNGAAPIHDFEISLMGNTSEDVLVGLKDGTFGMAEETGAFMNLAIQKGVKNRMGVGEALGHRMTENEGEFIHRQHSLLYNTYRLGIPYTVHIAIGTDIIHQHPLANFADIGWASGQDFKIYAKSVSKLEGGVFCNFGSAVIGPEVFLKAISIVRNLGFTVKHFTAANFDLVPLEKNYRKASTDNQPTYYYRPKKNIIIRPTALGGKGYHINADHLVTIPNLYRLIRNEIGDEIFPPITHRLPVKG